MKTILLCIFLILEFSGCRKLDNEHYKLKLNNNSEATIAAICSHSTDTLSSEGAYTYIESKATGIITSKVSYEDIISRDANNQLAVIIKSANLQEKRKVLLLPLDSLEKQNWTITYP